MKLYVESNQSLKTQPGFIPNRDGPEIKFSGRGKTIIK
jgi:ribosomal protein S6E (S10)